MGRERDQKERHRQRQTDRQTKSHALLCFVCIIGLVFVFSFKFVLPWIGDCKGRVRMQLKGVGMGGMGTHDVETATAILSLNVEYSSKGTSLIFTVVWQVSQYQPCLYFRVPNSVTWDHSTHGCMFNSVN